MKKITLISGFVLFLAAGFIRAQDINILKTEVVCNDTLAAVQMKEVVVFTKKEFASNQERLDFERMKRNTIKVYPYVQMAVEIYKEMNADMEALGKKRMQKKYVKNREEELRAEFEAQIRDLTKNQGIILIKLVNRETGNNCYQIIKDLKNPVTAFVWNSVGKRYGLNLKEEYIPEENQDLEFIVRMLKDE